MGIKIVNVETNRVVKVSQYIKQYSNEVSPDPTYYCLIFGLILQVLGRLESSERFLQVTLFQGVPKVDSQLIKVCSWLCAWQGKANVLVRVI